MWKRIIGGAVLVLALVAAAATVFWYASHRRPSYVPYDADIEYLKIANAAGPAEDPRPVFLLMSEFVNANRTEEGLATFESYLQRYDSQLSPAQRSTYLSAYGLLRAVHSQSIFPLKLYGWMNQTVAILEDARRLTNNDAFLPRWVAGVVYAQLPGFFGKRQAALEDLNWCAANIAKAPDYGWIREVYYQLGRVHQANGEEAEAQKFLHLSGYKNFEKQITLTTNFSTELKNGYKAGPRRFTEVVPGRVFTLSGFEFSDFNFIVSENRRELIAIDAGTTPGSADEAYKFLTSRVADLPPLTTLIVTHAHWDHIGGHQYYRQVNPGIRVYARDDYAEELRLVLQTPLTVPYFLGTDFGYQMVSDFKPTELVAKRTTVTIGGTRLELIPVSGGETRDAMFIYLPDHSVLFIGDFLMPYFGGPFKEEGDLAGLFDSIDVVAAINPRLLVHGHEPLTKLLNSAATLTALKRNLLWLRDQTLTLIHKDNMGRVALHRQNLIPPSFRESAEIQLVYLAMRDNFISRLYDRDQGYWHLGDFADLEQLGPQDYGALLTEYLGLSEGRIADAVGKMVDNGDSALAAETLKWALARHPESERLLSLRTRAFLKLKEKNQALNPFKFIIYSQLSEDQTPQLETPVLEHD